MTVINFPDSPVVDDTHTVNGKVWIWTGTSWNVVTRIVSTVVPFGNLDGGGPGSNYTGIAPIDGGSVDSF